MVGGTSRTSSKSLSMKSDGVVVVRKVSARLLLPSKVSLEKLSKRGDAVVLIAEPSRGGRNSFSGK